MSKTITLNAVTVGDGSGRFAPATSRRLFYFEQQAAPVRVGSSKPPQTRVRFNLPDNGNHRLQGPGIYESGRVTKVVHEPGCPFPRMPCDGEADCARVPSVDEMSDDVLRGRISDLAYLFRTQPETKTALPVRVAELEALRAALALRQPAEATDA
jgi:hypothetical protein